MALINTRIIGPIFFYEPLNGERYLDLLRNEVEGFLDNLPVDEYNRVIYQQDGAPAHNSRAVVQYLNDRYGEN